MKHSLILVLTLLILVASAAAQTAPAVSWYRTYGGPSENVAAGVITALNGDIVVVGWTRSFGAGGSDVYLLRMNEQGDTLWTRTYGGIADDYGYSICETVDHGFAISGGTQSFGGNQQIYMIRTDASGALLWQRTFGGSGDDYGQCICQLPDGGFAVGGVADGGYALLRVTAIGDSVWKNIYGSGTCYSLELCSDGGLGSVGSRQQNCCNPARSCQRPLVVRIDSAGTVRWSYEYYDPAFGANGRSHGYSIAQTSDHGFVIGGVLRAFEWPCTNPIPTTSLVLKLDTLGNQQWVQQWSTLFFNYGWGPEAGAKAITVLYDNNIVFAGTTPEFGPIPISYFAKVSSSGVSSWFQEFGGGGVNGLAVSAQGGFTMAGYNGTTLFVTTTDPDPAAQKIRVILPNGGETFRALETDTIRWFGDGRLPAVRIELNRDFPNGPWVTLVDSTGNDGMELAYIPEPLSSSCRIRITSIGGPKFYDLSDSNFTVSSSQGYLALADVSQSHVPVTSWNAGPHECPEGLSQIFRLKNFGTGSIAVFDPLVPSSANFTLADNCPGLLALAAGEMSACSLILSYSPQYEGSQQDTLRIQTNAINAVNGYVRIPLSGSQTRIPASPQIVIQTQGQDARLAWSPVVGSTGGCPINVAEYMVFYSEVFEGPFWYHGYTTDTSYVHERVLVHADGMFYHVIASTVPLSLLMGLPPNGENPLVQEEQVLKMLRRSSGYVERVGE